MGTVQSGDNSSGIYDSSMPPPLESIPGRRDDPHWKPRAASRQPPFTFQRRDFPPINDAIKKIKEQGPHPEKEHSVPRCNHHPAVPIICRRRSTLINDAMKKNKEQGPHPEKEQSVPRHPPAVLITCRACSVLLNSSDFSKTQMKKNGGPRCKNCIKKEGQSSFPCLSPTVGSEVRFTAQRASALSFQLDRIYFTIVKKFNGEITITAFNFLPSMTTIAGYPPSFLLLGLAQRSSW